MSKRLTGLNPLAYLGVEPISPPQMYLSQDTSPTVNDRSNFNIGDLWVNVEAQDLFVLVSLAQGIATWVSLTGNSASTFVTDSGSAAPLGGILNLLGDGVNISTSGSGNTIHVSMAASPILTNVHITGTLEVDGTTTLNGGLTLTGFTNGVLTVNNSGVVGEVTTTNHSLLVGNSSGTITSLGAATNGQIPIGSTGNDPVLATISAGSGISVTNGAGSIQIAATGSFGSPVTVPNGGTGDTSFTPYAVICGGTTSTNPLQSVASVGTVGQVLTSNGAGALPTFQAAGGGSGSGLAFIQKQTVSSVTSVVFNTGITTSFNNYLLVSDSVSATQTGSTYQMILQVSTDGGATYKTTGYQAVSGGSTSGLTLASFPSSNMGGTGIAWAHSPLMDFTSGGAANYPSCAGTFGSWDGSTGLTGTAFDSLYATPSTLVNAFKIVLSTGAAFSGSFTLYGLEQAGSSGGTLTVDGNSGSATPAAGILNVVGTGGITTSASGNTVTINGSNVPLSLTTTLTSTQIKNLAGSPITVLAAPGANRQIVVRNVDTFFSYGGTNPFTTGTNPSIVLYYDTNVNGNQAGAAVLSSTSYTQSASLYQFNFVGTPSAGGLTAAGTVNKPIVVGIDSLATDIGGNAANDNEIIFVMQYEIVDVSTYF